MKKLTAATMNMVLALGVILILAGVLFFGRVASNFNAHVESWPVIMTVAGAIIFYLSLVRIKYVLLFFTGLFSVLAGTLFMIICSGLIPDGLKNWWPLVVVLAGLCVLLTGIAKDRRIRVACLLPSVLFMILGVFFLLFSLDIIKMSFSQWMSIFWPLFPICAGLALILIFYIQQNSDSHFPYDNGESEGEGEVKE